MDHRQVQIVQVRRAVAQRPALPVHVSHGHREWSGRYGERHRLRRIENWPVGIDPPRKVRVYFRADHFVLQWWDPQARRNLCDRVDGDLVAAIARAPEIDQRLLDYKASGHVGRRLRHPDLVARFLADMENRATAGQVEPRTVLRYRSALSHYLAYTSANTIACRVPAAIGANREFALEFAAFLKTRCVPANGCSRANRRLMRGDSFVWNAVRAMYQWAADVDRGGLLPATFRNPFLRRAGDRSRPSRDPFGQPDISMAMAADLLALCDPYQFRIFSLYVFYGLRAAETCYLFGEHVEDGWLKVPCIPDLAYTTKGKRDKRLPLIDPLRPLLEPRPGLLLLRRGAAEGKERPPLLGSPLAALISEFQTRLTRESMTAGQRQCLRDRIIREAGGLSYDRVEDEFRGLAVEREWGPVLNGVQDRVDRLSPQVSIAI